MMNNIELAPAYLLLNDLDDAQHLSAALRSQGIVAYFFRHLHEFWYASVKELPSLAIVDVRKMSDGDFLLCAHPAVVRKDLRVVFFYSESTEPLLVSTLEFVHYGLIKKRDKGDATHAHEANEEIVCAYQRYLKVILGRVLQNITLGVEVNKLQREIAQLKKKNGELAENFLRIKEEQGMASSVLKVLKIVNSEHDFRDLTKGKSKGESKSDGKGDLGHFLEVICAVVEQWPRVKFFSISVLHQNQKEIISPRLKHYKYRSLPALPLQKMAIAGIDSKTQDLALEVALGVLEGNCLPLFVYGRMVDPELVIFLSGEDNDHRIPYWNFMEVLCNYCYQRIVVSERMSSPLLQSISINPWQLVGVVDGHLIWNNKKSALLEVDFTALLEVIKDGSCWGFSWEVFIDDLLNSLLKNSNEKFNFSFMGINRLVFLVEDGAATQFMKDLHNTIKSFAYDEYFRDITLSSSLKLGRAGILPEVIKVKSSSSVADFLGTF
ncbi:MAG: hypothetical protein HQK53_04655 [Oligoflexia bacterium]|nr:hypothetical protein [Oligoflexia bacterium]